MKIALLGHGKMGKGIAAVAPQLDHEVITYVSHSNSYDHSLFQQADVVIDVSSPRCLLTHLEKIIHKPLVIGSTGWTEKELGDLKDTIEKQNGSALLAPNFSPSVHFFIQLLAHAQQKLNNYDAIGIELHHTTKKDAPSGTAKRITQKLDIPFTAVRCGSFTGQHEVIFDSPTDTITLKHTSRNRESYILGAFKAAEWIKDKQGWNTLDEMYGPIHSTDNPL